jgi:hypothetical protein
MVVEVGSEPGIVMRGRGSEWDRDLGRVRLGYDMVRIRVRWRAHGRYLRLWEISHLNVLETLSRVHIRNSIGEFLSVRLIWKNLSVPSLRTP